MNQDKKNLKNNIDEFLMDMTNPDNYNKNKTSYNNTKKQISFLRETEEEELDLVITAKIFFLDEYCREAIENNIDVTLAREEAREIWNSMKDEDKAKYEKKVNLGKGILKKIISSNPVRINGYNLFTRDLMAKARNEGSTKTIVDCAKEWRYLDKFTKEKYNSYALLIREERTKLKEGLLLTERQEKVKLPWGPFKYYVIKLMKENKIEDLDEKFIKESSELWNDLPIEEKNIYILIAAKEHHDYVAKRFEFLLQIRKKNKRPKSAFNLFTNDLELTYNNKIYRQEEFFDYVFEKWNSLEEQIKEMYEKKAEKEKLEFINKIQDSRQNMQKEDDREDHIVESLSTEWSQGSNEEKRDKKKLVISNTKRVKNIKRKKSSAKISENNEYVDKYSKRHK